MNEIAGRPPSAPVSDPHWVVLRVRAKEGDAPIQGRRPWETLFRHSTEAAANAEALRLSKAFDGCFRVYASGATFRSETTDAAQDLAA